MLATIVDTTALWESALAALLSGIGIAFTVSLAILGATASVEASRDHKTLEAGAYAALGILALLATIGAIVFGIIVMAAK